MKTLPLVSVIIPTYARSLYIHRAIESILAQTYKNIEIIVVDDNGKGTENQIGTYQILKTYIEKQQIIYISHDKNRNGAAARNTGIFNAKGDYICFLDDDDEFFPDKIEKQVEVLINLDSSWGGVYCNSIDRIIKKDKTIEKFIQNHPSKNLKEDLLLCKTRFGSSSLMLRKEICIQIGGFDETFKRHQDWEFLVRILQQYKLKLVEPDKALIYYNILPTNTNKPSNKNIATFREKYLEKFKTDIESSKNRNNIYYTHYYNVGTSLLYNTFIKDGFKYIYTAFKYNIRVFDIFKIPYYIIKGYLCQKK
jgi:hypothetical protein BACCOPRO_00943